MRNILLMLKNNFSRNIIAVVLVIAGVFLLSTCLSSGTAINDTYSGDKIPVGLMSNDNSELAEDLEKYLSETLDMAVTKDNNADNQMDLLINKKISAIIEVPDGFGQSALNGKIRKLTFSSLDDYENAAFIEIYLNSYMRKVQVLSTAADGDSELFSKLLKNSSAEVSEIKAADSASLAAQQQQSGFALGAGAFLMISMGISSVMALIVLDDKKFGTYERMQISPVKPFEYIMGTTLFGILLGFIFSFGFMLMIAIGGTVTGVPMWLICVLLLLFTLFSVGFSLIVALTAKNKITIMTIVCGGTTIMCILGGAWFPVDKSNVLISKFAMLTPHYWFMEAIRGVQENAQFNAVPSILMLTLFALLTYLVSAALFTKKQ